MHDAAYARKNITLKYIHCIQTLLNIHKAKMDALRVMCCNICNLENNGGRCISLNSSVIHIMDIDAWTNEMSQMVYNFMPNTTIDIVSTSQSINGWMVIIQRKQENLFKKRAISLCMIGLTLVITWEFMKQHDK